MAVISTDMGQVVILGLPNKCPFCHRAINPDFRYGHKNGDILEVFFVCPHYACEKSFIGYYDIYLNGTCGFREQTTVGNLVGKEFGETIKSISENFIIIYNQAFAAEQQQLTEICGVGFRKALEFLIKDYIINNKPDSKEKVEKKLLGVCISEYVDDERIKTVAKRAIWLGNDETHYIRKWEGKNLEDLKKLIDLTVHWIEMESLTKSFESEMPDS
jgi:hypothetical protein